MVLLRMKIEDLNQYQITLLCIMEYLKETSPNDFSNVHTGIRDELFLFSLNPEAVSYTHLDVYKRQWFFLLVFLWLL